MGGFYMLDVAMGKVSGWGWLFYFGLLVINQGI